MHAPHRLARRLAAPVVLAAAAALPACAAPQPAPAPAAWPEWPRRVSLSFQEEDIARVIQAIASVAEANIVYDPEEVRGTVAVHLHDMKWTDALRAVARTRGYSVLEEEGGVVRLVPGPPPESASASMPR